MGENTTPEVRRYQAEGTDWGVEHPEAAVIDNFIVRGGPNVPYYGTLVTAPKIEGVAGANGGRTLIFIERDKGTGYCGTAVITISRSPKGRWHVLTEQELVFISETETQVITRATRASVINPAHTKLTDRMHVQAGEGWSNGRRIGGPPIQLEVEVRGWSPQLAAAGRLMDIYTFAKESKDLIGRGAFLGAFQQLEDEIADEVWYQLRHAPET